MILLSKLKGFEIKDEKENGGSFADLGVALLDSDYPIVNYLIYKIDKKFFCLPWEAVLFSDWKGKRINVSDFSKSEEIALEPHPDYVLLKYEVLDALLLDLENRRAVRANDLVLREEDGRLELRSADTGISPILRRISFGLYNHVSRFGLYDWKNVEFLRGDPQAVHNGAGYHLRITRLPPGEIAQLTNFIPYLHAAELLTLLPDAKAVKTLEVMPVERQLQVFEELDEEQAARLLAIMAPDAAADLVGRLQTDSMKKFLEIIPREASRRIVELLRYPEDTVGGIMTNDVIYLCADLTIAEARERMREHFPHTDFVYFIFIVSDEESRTLRGMISLRSIFAADDDKRLEEIMDPYIATLDSTEPAREAAYRVAGSQLAAMPVVGRNRKLLGAVTIDAAITEITPPNNSETLRIFS